MAILESNEVAINVVADYATGPNWVLGTAACAALCTRADRAEAMATIVERIQYLRPWTVYYALRYFESLDSPPPIGALLMAVEEWWGEHPFIPAMLIEHLTIRSERGEIPSFGEALARATPSQVVAVESLLKKIAHPVSHQLLATLAVFRRVRIDREYLQTFGRFVDASAPERALLVEHDALTDHLAYAQTCLLQDPPRSLLVVGEPRSGKSSFIAMLARRAEAAGWTVFEAGGLDLQAGQIHIGELEERLRRLTAELAVAKRVLWHAPDLQELAMSGTHKYQNAGVLDQVLPAIVAGRIVLVSEITPAGLTNLLQQRPAIRTALELVRLRPLTDVETDRLASEVAVRLSAQLEVGVAPDVLETATHLSRHYLGTSHMPGAVLDLLTLSLQRASAHDARQAGRDEVLATMAQLTGMPKQVLDDRERVDLASLRTFFSTRVIGQDEAIDAVVDRVAMLKAGLTDASKPVAVFLFAGPTGTGKTELAKTLAEFLFGSADRLVRLDMSEFQAPDSIRKIVGEPEVGLEGNALTDRVRKQPFSVVLLDEFEKAHANIWDIFLQVFDDGRLSDGKGHTVDFRHCIIILTSNLGSTIRQEAAPGFLTHESALSHQRVMKAINQSFRPEFINRLDRILVFRPLGREQMRSIVAKELSLVLERRGLRNREWAVEWEASALEFLLDKGFSPAMGARPLKRAIDRHLLAPLAATLVEHRFPEGDQFLFVRSDGRALQVEFVDPDAPDGSSVPLETDALAESDASITLARMILQPTGNPAERVALAAELRRLERGLCDEEWERLQSAMALRMQEPDFWGTADRQAILSRFEVMDRVVSATATARSLAGRLDRSQGVSGRYSKELIARLASHLFVLTHGLEDALSDAPVEVVLTVQPVLDGGTETDVNAKWCARLREMYRQWAARRGMQLTEVAGPYGRDVLLVISGFGVARLLAGEIGLHVLDYEDRDDSGRTIARVIVRQTPPVLPESPSQLYALLAQQLAAGAPPSTVVRRYRLGPSPMIRDVRLGWRTGRVELVFAGHFDLIGDASTVVAE